MNSTSTQFVPSSRLGIYDPINQMEMWGDFKGNGFLNTPQSMIAEMARKSDILNASPSMIVEMAGKSDNQSEDISQGTQGPSNKYESYDREVTKPNEKVLRRLAQNREAARKSRLRKKAYVQQLENCKLKLIQLEQELERERQQGAFLGGGFYVNHLSYSGAVNSGIALFEVEYGNWVEERNRRIAELRTALLSHDVSDTQIGILVDGSLNHYFDLFRMKATAAKIDVFYLMYGMWKTSAERFFLWIGGFRPSELLQVLHPHLQPIAEGQASDVSKLKESCQQAEDALSQGMDKLRQDLVVSVATGELGEGSFIPLVATAIEKLEAVECFVKQADYLRQETLLQMSRILTPRQTARGLLALGEYFEHLRSLSSIWATHSHESS